MALETLTTVIADPLTFVSIIGMLIMLAVGIWRGVDRGPDEVEILLARGEGRAPRKPVRNIRRDAVVGSMVSLAIGAVFVLILPSSPRPGIVTYTVAAYLVGMMIRACMELGLSCIIWLRYSPANAREAQAQERE